MTGTSLSSVVAGVQVDRLPVFYKQRMLGLYPSWAYTLPTSCLRVFYSLTEAGIWSLLVYWLVGFAPEVGRSADALHGQSRNSRSALLWRPADSSS